MVAISQLQSLVTPDNSDLLFITDINGGIGGKPKTKKITVADLLKSNTDAIQANTNSINSLSNSVSNLITQVTTNTQNIATNTSAIAAINAVSRPKILWKVKAEGATITNTLTNIWSIVIPANTCTVDSIIDLNLNFNGTNTTSTKTVIITCNNVTITNFTIAGNAYIPFRKVIAFTTSLNAPYTSPVGSTGYNTNTLGGIGNFGDFSQQQTVIVKASTTATSETFGAIGGYLALI